MGQPQPMQQQPAQQQPALGTNQSNTMIAPPPPMTQSQTMQQQSDAQQQQATQQKLNEAESENSGRGFEIVYIDGSIGGSYINMAQFDSTSLGVKKTSSGGPSFSIGGGIRLLVFVAGVRLRYNALSLFNLWQMNAEAGLKLPLGNLDLLIGLHGGYSFVGRLGDANAATTTSTPTSNDQVSIRGFNAGLELAIDYYVTPMFSVGAGALGDFLYLKRPPVDKPAGFDQLPAAQQQAITNDPLYKESGTTAGLEVGGMLRLGVHFDL